MITNKTHNYPQIIKHVNTIKPSIQMKKRKQATGHATLNLVTEKKC